MTRTKCPECNDTGGRDSGGTYPWGEPVLLPCDCKDVEIFRQRTRQEQAMGALAKQAQELQLGYEAGESDLHDMVRWAYSKLHHASYSKQEDALMLDRMKRLLEHGA